MTRATENALFDFAADQRREFRASAWLESAVAERPRLALVALLLSGTRWYGHQDSLLQVAAELDPDCIPRADHFVSSLNFDCARFLQMLEARVSHAADGTVTGAHVL